MANTSVLDGTGEEIFLKGSGAGTDLDPRITEHLETNSAAIKTALELIDNTVSGNELQVDVVTMPTVAVTGTFYQATQPVSGTVAVTGVATSANQSSELALVGAVTETAPANDTASSGLNGRLQRIAQNITTLLGRWPAALGGTTSANSLPVVLSSDGPFAVATGSITETAPTTDTGSSGLNGRLQRIAQRLTSLFAPRAAAITNVHVPASNTAAVITYAAGGAGVSHVISGIAWSYSVAPTSGNLKIEDGSGTTVFSVDVTAAGPGFIPFAAPLKGTANTAMIITLAAGGSGVSGKVNALGKWTE